MKKIFGYVFLLGILSFNDSIAQSSASLGTVNFAELRAAILEKPLDLAKANGILEEIRCTENLHLVDSLEQIKKAIQLRMTNQGRYIKSHGATSNQMIIPIDKTITFLKLELFRDLSGSAKCTILIDELYKKFAQNEVPNAEIGLLYEDVTPLTLSLFITFDTTNNEQLRGLISNSLRASNDPNLEDLILKRIDKYLNDVPVAGRMIFALSEKGTKKSLNKLEEIREKTDDENLTTIVNMAFEKFRERGIYY